MGKYTQAELISLFLSADKETQEIVNKLLNLNPKQSKEVGRLIENSKGKSIKAILIDYFSKN